MEITTVKEKLKHIQTQGKEAELFPFLQKLFVSKGYNNVEITHGKDEYGKDIVFKEHDEKLKKDRWFAVVVKNKNAEMRDFEEGGEISRQINLSFQYPFKDSNGNDNSISQTIVVINGNVGTQSKEIISKILKPQYQNNVDIWNCQKLEEEIEKEMKDFFLNGKSVNKENTTTPKSKSQKTVRVEKCIANDVFFKRLCEYHKNNTIRPMIDEEGFGETKQFTTTLDIAGEPISFEEALSLLNPKGVNTLLIYGKGGAGKTFMLLNQVLLYNEPDKARHLVYLPLNELTLPQQKTNTDYLTITDYLNDTVFRKLDWEKHYSNPDNELLFFFDGFNEVPVERRPLYAKEIKKLSTDLNCRVVVASRFEDTLAEQLYFGIEASIRDLTIKDIEDYLKYCEYHGNFPLEAHLSELLKNPLLLTLFGNTTKYQRKKIRYFKKQTLCRWFDSPTSDSQILWNYLNCEIMKVESTEKELIFKNWLSIRFIWSKIAFFMQQKNYFNCSREELYEQIEIAIDWIKKNAATHKELQLAAKLSFMDFGFEDFEKFLNDLNPKDFFQHLSQNHALFGGSQGKYKFFHQSIRDCLAAVHLLNVAPTKENKFPEEWSEQNFSKNIYMLRHLSELAKTLDKEETLTEALNILRTLDIPKNNQILNNLLLIFRQPPLRNGDFSTFDFSGLDLRYCELTEFTLSKNGFGAKFTNAKIGEDTFQRASHNTAITSIAVSSDGTKVLSCGKDKVLLWNFSDRTVEKELYRFSEGLGEYEDTHNQVAFSQDNNCLLFTDGIRLFEIDTKTGYLAEYDGSMFPIFSISAKQDTDGIEYYFACDKSYNVCRWQKGQVDSLKVIPKYDDQFVSLRKTDSSLLLLIDCFGSFYFTNKEQEIVWDLVSKSQGVFALNERGTIFASALKEEKKLVILDLSREKFQNIKLDFDILKIIFSTSCNYLIAIGIDNVNTKDAYIKMLVFQRDENETFGYKEKPITETSLDNKTQIQTALLLENLVFYGLNTGKINVDTFHKDDEMYLCYTWLDNHSPFIEDITISHQNSKCIVAYEDGYLREWDFLNGAMLYKFEKKHIAPTKAVTVAHEKDLIVSGDANGKIMLWDSDNRLFIREIGDFSKIVQNSWDINAQSVRDIVFTHDDAHIIASSDSGIIAVWNISKESNENEKISFWIDEHKSIVNCLLYYRVGNEDRLVSGDRNGCLIFWKIDFQNKNFEILGEKKLNAHGNHRIRSLALSPDKIRLVSYGEDDKIKEWSAETGDYIREFNLNYDRKNSINSDSISFSSDGTKLYLTGRTDTTVPVIELVLDTGTTKILYDMQQGPTRNDGVIVVHKDNILSGGLSGCVYSCSDKGTVLHQMRAYSSISEKLKFIRGLDEAYFEPKELRTQFVGDSPIKGKLEEWLRDGIIVNFIELVRCIGIEEGLEKKDFKKYSKLRQSSTQQLRDTAVEVFGENSPLFAVNNVYECLHIITKSFLACTHGNDGVPLEGESDLFEAMITYSYDECPHDEQIVLFLIELLLAAIIPTDSTSGYESNLDRLFDKLEEKETSRTLQLYKRYKKEYGHNNKDINDIVNSLFIRLEPLFKRDDEGKINIIPTGKIHQLAVTLVCNRPESINCPIEFDEFDKAQVIFLELVFHYMNNIADSERTFDKLLNVLDSDVNESMKIFEQIIDVEQYSTHARDIAKFLTVDSNAKKLADVNQKLSDWWRGCG